MFDEFRATLLRWLKVPHTPDLPAGSPDSIRVFRAGANLYTLKLIEWAVVQLALVWIPIALTFAALASRPGPRAAWIVAPMLKILATLAVVGYVTEFLLSYATVRLNYEMRWYIVTDRSLRIRTGIWSVQELTMTYANIQQVNLTRGPLQTLLGLGDLEVTSAGGGAVAAGAHGARSRSHSARFEGVDNAEAIRDLILDRLKRYRDAGLGDPDEHDVPTSEDPQLAAQAVLSEVRKLSAILTSEF